MSGVNQKLAAVAGLLLALSVFMYWSGEARAERFERGQRFLPNLNPDEIGDIVLVEDGETLTLKRVQGESGEDEYQVAEKDGYLAKNESVNRLIRALLETSLAREVGTGAELASELGIEPPGEGTVDVTLLNSGGQEMVHLRVGNSSEEGDGNFVRRIDQEDAPIYLTESLVTLDTDASLYLRKQIVDVPAADVVRVEGPDFLLDREEEGTDVVLVDIPRGRKAKSSEVSKVKGALSRLEFEDVFLADDPEVAGMDFVPALEVSLADDSRYIVSVAKKEEATFLRVEAFHDVERIEISREESEEELQDKSEILKRADEVARFNNYHGSWVYEVTDFVGDKFALTKADLTEPESE